MEYVKRLIVTGYYGYYSCQSLLNQHISTYLVDKLLRIAAMRTTSGGHQVYDVLAKLIEERKSNCGDADYLIKIKNIWGCL